MPVPEDMTDTQWERQNTPLHPDEARSRGLCWQCGGQGALYSAFGGGRIKVTCNECKGSGQAGRAS